MCQQNMHFKAQQIYGHRMFRWRIDHHYRPSNNIESMIDDAYYNLKMSLKKIEMRYYPPGINLSFKEEG